VLDPSDRVLLFSFAGHDGATGWFTPGGGLRRGETLTADAVRELAEETGFVVAEPDLGPVTATRGGLWQADDGTLFFGADSFNPPQRFLLLSGFRHPRLSRVGLRRPAWYEKWLAQSIAKLQ
jgi:8-oxo-dGTP pyrophosphatase MutT (NUDIX family)